jgi:curli biogenesis system outer membrane secretion channel CsgG
MQNSVLNTFSSPFFQKILFFSALRQQFKACLILILSFFSLTACVENIMPQAGTKTTVTNANSGGSLNDTRSESYNGPKARIAVAKFTNKTGGGWYNHGIGTGMKDQLSTALVNTGRYIVLERDNMDAIMEEQSFGQSGLVKGGTAARMGQIEGAELLIVAAITEFSDNSGGTRGGVGGGAAGLLGGVLGGVKKAHIAIDLRVIDAQSSRVLAATSVEGESTDVNLGAAVGGYFGVGGAVGGLQSWKNTPKGKALRSVINQAVEFVVSKTPTNFYRQGSSNNGGADRARVKALQTMLAKLGYSVGTPDGLAGKMTKTAIREFQTEKSLPVTGAFDDATAKALREAVQSL